MLGHSGKSLAKLAKGEPVARLNKISTAAIFNSEGIAPRSVPIVDQFS